MRIGIIALQHESNTFLAQPTELRHFEQDLLVQGEEVRTRLQNSHHEVAGFFAGTIAAGAEPVGVFAARALPYGAVTAAAFEGVVDRMLAALAAAGPLDGLLVAPHGAAVSESAPDADGEWLMRVRRAVGELPVVGTLDPHGNLSPRMVSACHALIAYRTNPHLDQRERGVEAARLLVRMLRGEVAPIMAASFPPLAVNIERQRTSDPHCRELYAQADAQLRAPGVLSNSLLLGFPYADVAEMGAATICIADRDAALAARGACALADAWWHARGRFVGELIDVAAALDDAAQQAGPVCLLDMGDNVGGGSPGDSTILLHALHARGSLTSFACLFDPEAAAAAAAAGPGAIVDLCVGGKTDDRHGAPFCDRFTVLSVHDGRFFEPQPRHGGMTEYNQGATAVVRGTRGLTIMLTTRRMPPFSLQQLTSCGIDPAAFRVLVAKGVHAPVAAYAPVCPRMIRVNTPGATTADLSRLTFCRRRRPLFPFEDAAAWQANVGAWGRGRN